MVKRITQGDIPNQTRVSQKGHQTYYVKGEMCPNIFDKSWGRFELLAKDLVAVGTVLLSQVG